MRTSTLLVDILIIGLLPFIWIICLIVSYILPIQSLEVFITKSSILSSLLTISIIYVIGNIADYINAYIFGKFKLKAEKELESKISVIKILAKNPDLHRYLDSHFSRIRITKAALLNIMPIALSLSIMICKEIIPTICSQCQILNIIIVNLIALIFFGLSLFSYKKRVKTYCNYLEQAHKETKH